MYLMNARTSMSGVDLAWLRMERPTNPMVILCVLTFAGRVKLSALRALVETRLLRFERFRQMPVLEASGAYWQADPDFTVETHVQPLVLPPRSTQAQLEAAASELASTALDARHPLWQIHLIERYRKGSALIARFHHCYADGIAMMRVLATLADTDPNVPSALVAQDTTPLQRRIRAASSWDYEAWSIPL